MLSQEDNVIPVTIDTPHLALETMDAKLGNYYPVFMINDQYGGRGLNFRACNNRYGITMLILGSFPDRNSEIQTLFRVGRFGDACTRIRDTKFAHIDEDTDAARKGTLDGFLTKIRKKKAEDAKKGKGPQRSLLEFESKHLTNS